MDLSERRDGRRRHPWEVTRAEFYRRVIGDHVDTQMVRRVLDVGAGDGWFASELKGDLRGGAMVTCWDSNYTPEELHDDIGEGVVRTAIRPAGTFDLVVALDVLEHVTDDEGFLVDEIVPAIAPGALALLSVPTHRWLFSNHDRALKHERRYAPDDFFDLIGRHLDIVARGSLFSSLVAPRAAGVLAERVGLSGSAEGVGGWHRGRLVTAMATGLLRADAGLGRRLSRRGRRLPALSVWVVAKRPAGGTA